jgi:hypothetical protein
VKDAKREMKGFIASKCYIAQTTVKICQVLQAGKVL